VSTIPGLAGTIDRRLLINYRVDAEVLRRFLPPPFRPQLVAGASSRTSQPSRRAPPSWTPPSSCATSRRPGTPGPACGAPAGRP
jgi:hypothetical protein